MQEPEGFVFEEITYNHKDYEPLLVVVGGATLMQLSERERDDPFIFGLLIG